jgi:prepilin-type N-terminal cleavage/methylation domain-containing protein
MEIMTIRKRKYARAVTLIEVMAAMAILVISSTGALSYQYFSAKDAQKARAQLVATRVALLLLEDWKSIGGSKEYNPQTLGLGFSSPLPVPSHFSEGQGVGNGTPLHDAVHDITVDDIPMMVMLTWDDIDQDDTSGVVLRQLNVEVQFGTTWMDITKRKQYEGLKPVILTAYVRIDGAGG